MRAAVKFAVAGAVLALSLALLPPPLHALSVREEEELSRQVLKAVFQRSRVIEDPYITRYVSTVGRRILAHMPQQPFTYHFYVIEDPAFNAFAIPAGHVFVNSGLFAAMESEEELAGILGHEIAHVYSRHISEKIERSKKIGLATLAGVAAGVLLGAKGGGAAAQAMTMGSAAAGMSAELAYSRDNEMQADQLGLKFLVAAGYDPSGLLRVLRKIREKKWFGTEHAPTYLSTHPAVEDRMAYIDGWVAARGTEGGLPPPVDPAPFRRVVTRLRVGYGDPAQVLAETARAVRDNPEDPEAAYHHALALARSDRRREAIDYFNRALTRRPFDAYILRDLAKTYFLDGQLEQAGKILAGVRDMLPDDPDTLFFSGRAELEQGRWEAAAGFFRRLTAIEPDYREAYFFLGKSLDRLDRPGEAAVNLGIYYHKGRDWKNAAVQYRIALKHLEDPARREQVEALLKESLKELEG